VTGPLTGLRVVEIGGLGPAPFCAMVLADLGADVLRIERPDKVPLIPHDTPPEASGAAYDLLSRGRPSAAIDLKHPDGAALVRRLTGRADAFVEGFRPGVAERLGIGPDDLCGDNPRLVYGRMTGWGRLGPLADQPGHDLNYLSVAGVLAHIGRAGAPPTPPLNLVADFGGGGLLLALGICAAIVERTGSGRGQVVDAAMIDGAALLMAPIFGASESGFWSDRRGTNLLDSGAPFYDCYECADGGYVAVAAIEPQFYAALLAGLDLADAGLPDQHDQPGWPVLRDRFAAAFRARRRDEWSDHFATRGACVTPVLTMGEAARHPHPAAWGTFTEVAGVRQPAPAPRFSRTPARVDRAPSPPGGDTAEALAAWGIAPEEIERLAAAGVVADG
jgi:alpha-methylacyl-CoA racemase